MKYKLGIICAGDDEIEPFLSLITNRSTTEKAMLKFYSGMLDGIDVVALFSGTCKTNAAIATQILIDTYGCNAVINAGTAGGMAPEVMLFDTVVSTECAYWDVSPDILTEFHPRMETIYFPAHEVLLAAAKQAVDKEGLSNCHFGRMITGEAFIEDQYRDQINETHAPLSVDMETASIAHVCYVNRIPFLAVRSITDTAEHSGTKEFDRNCKQASQRSAEVVLAILRELTAQ